MESGTHFIKNMQNTPKKALADGGGTAFRKVQIRESNEDPLMSAKNQGRDSVTKLDLSTVATANKQKSQRSRAKLLSQSNALAEEGSQNLNSSAVEKIRVEDYKSTSPATAQEARLELLPGDSAVAPSTAEPIPHQDTNIIHREVRARTAERNRRDHRNRNRVLTMNGNLHGYCPSVVPVDAASSQRSQAIIDGWERRDATPGKRVQQAVDDYMSQRSAKAAKFSEQRRRISTAKVARARRDSKGIARWINLAGSEEEREQLKTRMMRLTDVPTKIYVRHEDDIIRQLSSIGSKTYMSSHKSPYGDTAKVKTLTEAEYQGLWSRFRADNLDLIDHPEASELSLMAQMTSGKKNAAFAAERADDEAEEIAPAGGKGHGRKKLSARSKVLSQGPVQKRPSQYIEQDNFLVGGVDQHRSSIKDPRSKQSALTIDPKSVGGRSQRGMPTIIYQAVDEQAPQSAQAFFDAAAFNDSDSQEENAQNLKPYLPSNMARKSAYVRNADHMSQWSGKVHDRFAQMMQLLKGHKQYSTLGSHRGSAPVIDEDYLVEGKDQQYFHQRCENLVKAPAILGPKEVKYTSAQLRKQQTRNAKFSSTNYWDRQGRPTEPNLVGSQLGEHPISVQNEAPAQPIDFSMNTSGRGIDFADFVQQSQKLSQIQQINQTPQKLTQQTWGNHTNMAVNSSFVSNPHNIDTSSLQTIQDSMVQAFPSKDQPQVVNKRFSQIIVEAGSARSMVDHPFNSRIASGRPQYRTSAFDNNNKLNLKFTSDIKAMRQTMGDLMRRKA